MRRRKRSEPAAGVRRARLGGPRLEPDCAFYVGDRARGYLGALAEGESSADAFLERMAPDLVVEAEITSADEGKAGRYGMLDGAVPRGGYNRSPSVRPREAIRRAEAPD